MCCFQITILARKPDDELLLLASDGLWDVLTNQEACSLAKRCLRRARQRGATRQSAARIAATVLTRAAVDRGSRDNVTVVVVDLMSGVLLVDPAQSTRPHARRQYLLCCKQGVVPTRLLFQNHLCC